MKEITINQDLKLNNNISLKKDVVIKIFDKKELKERRLNKLFEFSHSKIVRYILEGGTFAVISAFRTEYDEIKKIMSLDEIHKENLINHKKLKDDIENFKYGYARQKSEWKTKDRFTGEIKLVEELSFFIARISYDKAFELSEKYNQVSIIFKDNERFFEVFTTSGIDTKDQPFYQHQIAHNYKRFLTKESGVITFDPRVLEEEGYSQLIKGTKNSRKKYSFIRLKEERIPSRTDVAGGQNEIQWYKPIDFKEVEIEQDTKILIPKDEEDLIMEKGDIVLY